MHRNFHSIEIKGNISDRGLPILVICNHVSWWDGIWALHVNQTLFHRKYFFMMLEEQLRKNWFLNYAGGYSIPGNSKGKLESIKYTLKLLHNPDNLVLMFPQGEIESMHKQHFSFKKGIAHILQRLENDVQVVFLVNITDYHANVKPTVYSFLDEYTGNHNLTEIEEKYNRFYLQCIAEQIKIKV
ncbi:MAG: lysophospholipid acyltransferase family protein [Mariniphaga sp.]